MKTKITIIYDNVSFNKNLQADWGFAALIETKDTPKILFDTGANGKILLNNMKKLKINPLSIKEIFISHLHYDHIGGLKKILKVNPNIKKIYAPFPLGIKNEIILEKAQKIYNNIFSTGKLDNIEQSMGIKTNKGIVLIVGCSHPKMDHILKTSKKFGKIYGIIGGLHNFSKFKLLKNLKMICPTHCTKYKIRLKKLYPQKYVESGAGRIIKIS